MVSASDSSDRNEKENQIRILDSIYDHLMTSIVVGYASNMHELIKTGEISATNLRIPSSRQETFPALYARKTTEEIQASLDQYATEIVSSRQSKKRKLRLSAQDPAIAKEGEESDDNNNGGDDDDDGDEDFKDESEIDKASAAKTTRKDTIEISTVPGPSEQQTPGVDVWGRIPPKEPKNPVECTLCGRHVSTTRFASHLEKCMGLSTRPLTGIPNRSLAVSSGLK